MIKQYVIRYFNGIEHYYATPKWCDRMRLNGTPVAPEPEKIDPFFCNNFDTRATLSETVLFMEKEAAEVHKMAEDALEREKELYERFLAESTTQGDKAYWTKTIEFHMSKSLDLARVDLDIV